MYLFLQLQTRAGPGAALSAGEQANLPVTQPERLGLQAQRATGASDADEKMAAALHSMLLQQGHEAAQPSVGVGQGKAAPLMSGGGRGVWHKRGPMCLEVCARSKHCRVLHRKGQLLPKKGQCYGQDKKETQPSVGSRNANVRTRGSKSH